MGNGPSVQYLHPPSGYFVVGCADIMTEQEDGRRFMRIFYPTDASGFNKAKKDQFPNWISGSEYMKGYAKASGYNLTKFRFMFRKSIGQVRLPVLWQAPLLSDQNIPGEGKYPVLVFSHDLVGNRTTYSSFCYDLASYGFIVAALEHCDQSASYTSRLKKGEKAHGTSSPLPVANRMTVLSKKSETDHKLWNTQLKVRVAECQRALKLLRKLNAGVHLTLSVGHEFNWSQFKGAFDFSRVGVVGHSFGGTTAIAALARYKVFKVGVVLDAWMFPLGEYSYNRLSQPVLFLNSEEFRWKENDERMVRLRSEQVDRIMLTVRGSVHHGHSDFAQLIKQRTGRYFTRRGTIKPNLFAEINRRFTVSFLSKHFELSLEGKMSSLTEEYKNWIEGGLNVA